MEAQSRKATIDDVAEQAGVSISTVSRVLNRRDRVHPGTRARVEAVINALRYRPNALARGLALKRCQTIGLLAPNITDPFFVEMVRGVEQAAAGAGYGLLIARQHHLTEQQQYLGLFTHGCVDGLVLVAIGIRRQYLDSLLEERLPFAVIQQDLGMSAPTFITDNYTGARAMGEHLIEHGFRRIAFIAGSDDTPDSADRLRGLGDALRDHGRSMADTLLARGDFSHASGYRAAAQLLDLPQPPDAIFAANDQMAVAAIEVARDRGLRIPEQLAVVGFDDTDLARFITPRLTTVRQPLRDMGRLATEAVIEALERRVEPRRTLMPTTLVVRESCGCAGPGRSKGLASAKEEG